MPEDIKAELATATDSLREYAVTHTTQDTMTYAKTLLDQMTFDALEWDGGSGTFSPDGLYDDAPSFLVPNGDAPLEFYGSNTDARRRCLRDQWEACRNEYNAELFQSAAIGTGVFLGCGALTAGSGIILCAAGGLAVHALGIAAARQRRAACEARAPYQCQ
ncbi:MAG TPA: hypothetical protein VJU84_14575 [Pyrinomonadaceae bacterium]|nr:hypothetical protein [Pyrinomonadaceae bacterium]